MPKSLKEFKNLDNVQARKGGRKVDWREIAEVIIESNKAFSVKEVHESVELVNQRVTRYRTKSALDKLVEDEVLEVRDDGKRFWYCRNTKRGGKSGRAD